MFREPDPERTARRQTLALLAARLAGPAGPAAGLSCRLSPPAFGPGRLVLRRRWRLRGIRVYCVSAGGGRSFLTSTGILVGAGDLDAAAPAVAAAARAC